MVDGVSTCVDAEGDLENCRMESEGTCQICQLNYYMSNGKCLRSDEYDLEMGSLINKAVLAIFVLFF